jgi:hypothetical protein
MRSLVAVVIALGLADTSANAGVLPIAGLKLGMKDNVLRPEKKKFQIESRDVTITLGGGDGSASDPVLHGGSVRVRAADGCGGPCDATFPLPADRWFYYGPVGAGAGYKFQGRRGATIASGRIKPGAVLKFTGLGDALPFALPADPRPVDVVVTIGDQAYCMTFGGLVTKMEAGKQFVARFAAAALCPP